MTSTTAAKVSQPGTPVTTFVIDSLRSSSEVHIRNEVGNCEGWSTPMPFASTDRLSTPLPPVERELFTRKLLDINYTEGSGDQKWKSVDFPWIKKLEVFFHKTWTLFIPFFFSVFHLCLLHFITIPGQQQESVWKSFIPSQSKGGDQCDNEWKWCFRSNANWRWKEPHISGIWIIMTTSFIKCQHSKFLMLIWFALLFLILVSYG